MLPLSLFRDRVTAMALLAAMILNLSFYGELFMLPFYFQNIRHYSVFDNRFGNSTAPWASTDGILSRWSVSR